MAATLPIGMTYCGLIRRLVLRRAAGCRAKVGRCVSPFLVSASLFFLSFWFDGWFSARTVFFLFFFNMSSACLFISTHSSAPPAVLYCALLSFYTRNFHWISGLLDTQIKHGAKSLDASLCYININIYIYVYIYVNTSVVTTQYILYRWKDFLFLFVNGATVVKNSQTTNSLWGQQKLKTRINGSH